MTSLAIILNSSRSRRFALLPRAESDAVTTFMYEEFLKTIWAFVPFILVCLSSISDANSLESGLSSSIIFSRTFILCPLVPEAIHIFVPGYNIHLITQNTALKKDLPIPRLPMKAVVDDQFIIIISIFWNKCRFR